MLSILKTDLLSSIKKLLPFCFIILIISAATAVILRIIPVDYPNYYVLYGIITQLLDIETALSFYAIAVIAPYITFRKFFYSKQSIMNMMLPLSSSSLILSKLLCAVAWSLISTVLRVIVSVSAAFISAREKGDFSKIVRSTVFTMSDAGVKEYILFSFLHMLILLIFIQLLLYFMKFYCFSNHSKVLGIITASGVLAFIFILYIIYSYISFKVLIHTDSVTAWYLMNMIYYAVISVILFILSVMYVNKKYELI